MNINKNYVEKVDCSGLTSEEIDISGHINTELITSVDYTNLKMSITRVVKNPQRGTDFSAGIDFFIPDTFNKGLPFELKSGNRCIIELGVYIDLIGSGLNNYALIFMNKSGVATKTGLVVGACVIDADYQGELMLNLYNPTDVSVEIEPGMKAIQGIILPVYYSQPEIVPFKDLYKDKSSRGDGRFGSTGN